MPPPLRPGDVVGLTSRYAATLERSPRHRIDWKFRHGVVVSINAYAALVRWNGLISGETIPLRALTKITVEDSA